MSFENPQQIIRSWALQGSFASGTVVQDKLVPKRFTRIRTPFVNTWREEAVNTNLDWGVQAFSFYLPESLRVISSMFLQIPLSALGGGRLQENPRPVRRPAYSVPERRAGVVQLRGRPVPARLHRVPDDRGSRPLLLDVPGLHLGRRDRGGQEPHYSYTPSELGVSVQERAGRSRPRHLAVLHRFQPP